MPLFSQTEQQILADILRTLVDDTNISRTAPGSKMRAFADAVSSKMGTMWQQFDRNALIAFLDGAEGQYLDFIGDLLNTQRLNAAPARISSTTKNQRFYVEAGTFGDINSGLDITIPKNTIISTGEDGTGIIYRTTIGTVLDSAASEAYVSIESARVGTAANVGRNQLIFHNFTNYSDSQNDTLLTTNDGDIFLARDVEIDANYKFRISQRVVEAQGANRTAIQLAALTVPGVADIVYLPFYRGIGTYDLILKSTTPVISQSLIDTVQEVIENVQAEGIIGKVRGPVEVGISLVGTLTLKNAVSADTQAEIIRNVTNNVTDYINSLDIGQELILNQLVDIVLSTSSLIKNVGTYQQPFDKIFKYQPSKLEDNKVRSKVINDITPRSDERIITETKYAGNTPILFRI